MAQQIGAADNLRQIRLPGLGLPDLPSNSVHSSRFSVLTVLPKSLLEQFNRFSNIWFLVVSIFQLIFTEVSVSSGWDTLVPLVLMLLFTLAKDCYLLYRQQAYDKAINTKIVAVWMQGQFQDRECGQLLVGQIVVIKTGEAAPADVLILASGSSDNICYVDTSLITGSSTLSIKKPVAETSKILKFIDLSEATLRIPKIQGEVAVQQPEANFNSFSGKIKLKGFPTASRLTGANLLLQGAEVKGTAWVIGLVVYAGPETKVRLNGAKMKRKTTALERKVNRLVLFLLPLLLLPTLISAILSTFATVRNEEYSGFFEKIVNFSLLYNNVIPISLFVSLDLVRLLQSFFLHRYLPEVHINNPDVNEDMGQCEYVITSKTGTMTKAEVRLKTIVVEDKEYKLALKQQDSETTVQDYKRQGSQSIIDDSRVIFKRPKFDEILERSLNDDKADFDVSEYMQDMGKSDAHRRLMQGVMVCHCLISHEIGVLGTSEELGLIAEAERFGFKFVRRDEDCMIVDTGKGEITVKLLGFTTNFQQTKRTRVLVQWPDEPFAVLFSKGPGSALKTILNISYEDLEMLADKEERLQRSGLRTVLYAWKEISSTEADTFEREFSMAARSLYNIEDRVDTLFEKYEEGSLFLGLLGIEETLVPSARETANVLQKAGMQTWLLSADTELSTVTTAFNLGLYTTETKVVSFRHKNDAVELAVLMTKAAKQMILGEEQPLLSRTGTLMLDCKHNDSFISPNVHRLQMIDRQNSTSHAMLRRTTMKIKEDTIAELPLTSATVDFSLSIDGISLETALRDADCRQLLMVLLFAAKGVSFNSVLPLQKAMVVRIVREQFTFSPVVIAVGSGDADIPMLAAANVGFSVNTAPKSRLSHVSDARIESISSLSELVLVHGRWNLMRIATLVLLFVYKNMLLTLFLMAYNFYSDYQPPRLFPQGLIAAYNILFTTFPVLIIGILDQDVTRLATLTHPLIYQFGVQGKFLTYRSFAIFLILSLCQTFIISMTIVPSLSGVLTTSGETESFEVIGTLLFIIIVAAVLGHISLLCSAITVTYCLSVLICGVILYAYIFISNWTDWADAVDVLSFIYKSGTCALRVILAPIAAVLFAYAVLAYIRLFHPTINDILRRDLRQFPDIIPWSRAATYESDLRGVYKSTSKLEKVDEIDASKLHPVTLKFTSKYMEKAYQLVYFDQFLPIFRVVTAILVCLLVSWLIYNSISNSKADTATSQSLMIVTLLLVLLATKLKGFQKRYIAITILCVFVVVLVKFMTELLFHRIGALSSSIIPVVTFGLLNVDFLANLTLNGLSLILITISLLLNFSLWSSEDIHIGLLDVFQFLILISGIIVTCSLLGFYTSKLDRLHFKLLSSIESQAEKVRSILCCFLPEFVRDRVRKGVRYIAEEKGIVTVVFCDICEFDAICAKLTPVELTSFLDEVFQKFDSACEMNGVFKVETVGKTYMACSGLKDSEKSLPSEFVQSSHARRAVEFAFHILRIVQKYRMANGSQMHVKIGINSGPVVAGVVGFHKPQFSLVGDTVNTASRMCSTIEVSNTIQISEATFQMLDDKRGIKFDEHILSGVKGKGDMKAFFVTEKPISLTSEVSIAFSEENTRRASQLYKNETFDAIMQPKTGPIRSRTRVQGPANEGPSSLLAKVCFGSKEDRHFRATLLKDTYPVIRCGLITAAAVRVAIVALRAVAYGHEQNEASDECMIAYSVSAGFTAILAMTLGRFQHVRWFSFIVLFLCVISSILVLSDFVYKTDYFPDLVALEVMYGTMILTFCSGLSYRWTIVGSIAAVGLWGGITPLSNDIGLHLANLTFIIGFAVICIYAAAAQERKIRLNNALKLYAEKEIQQTDDLLSHMLPPHVYESLKQEKNVTDKFSNVTILFADIVGFTSWSSNKTPTEVVTMLSELFTRFDKLCVTNLVYKVHTIGDCYVAMGYAGETSDRDINQECLNIVNLAFDMVKVIKEINDDKGSSLNMRIGIHTGEVIAGITGTNVVRYDIYGPDVLIANKMESNGQAGKVNVSDWTKRVMERSDETFEFTFNKDVEAKAVDRKHQSFFVSASGERKSRDKTARSSNSEIHTLALKAKIDTSQGEDLDYITLPA